MKTKPEGNEVKQWEKITEIDTALSQINLN